MKRLTDSKFGDLINASMKCGDEFDKDIELVKSPIVQKALKAQKAEDEQRIQEQILGVLDQSRIVRGSMVSRIRKLRKEANEQLNDLKRLDSAEKVGTDTGDFRPLLAILGHKVPDVNLEPVADYRYL